jgi:mannobiose 2-epimerase
MHLLIAARAVLGVDNGQHCDFYRGVLRDAVRYGEDRENGGFFHSGPVGQTAADRRKIWWVQAEALLACCELYQLSGDDDVFECFERTLGWITARQVDWDGGEWFAEIMPDGRHAGVKAGPWKAGYHTGRALLQCHAGLTRLRERSLGGTQ